MSSVAWIRPMMPGPPSVVDAGVVQFAVVAPASRRV